MNVKYVLKAVGTEGWRKRFMSVNRIVFKADGLWWERMAIGLEKLIPKPKTIAPPKKELMPKVLIFRRTPVKFEGQSFG